MQKPLYGLEILSALVVFGGLAFKVGRRIKKMFKEEKDSELLRKHKDVTRTDAKGYRVNVDKSELERVKKLIHDLEAEDNERAARLSVVIYLAGQGYDQSAWEPYAEDNWNQLISGLNEEDMQLLVQELQLEGMQIMPICEEIEMKEFKKQVR